MKNTLLALPFITRLKAVGRASAVSRAIALSATFALSLSGCAAVGSGPAKGAGTQDSAATTLQGAQWRVETIGGEKIVAGSSPELLFLAGNKLAGSGGCNRLLGAYSSVAPNQLSIETGGTTMMACPEAVMKQEQKLLGLLPQVKQYRIDKTGALVISTQGGTEIVARR